MREIAELAVRRSRRTALISEIPRWALPAAWRVIRPFDLNVAGLILVMAASGPGLLLDACGDGPAVRR